MTIMKNEPYTQQEVIEALDRVIELIESQTMGLMKTSVYDRLVKDVEILNTVRVDLQWGAHTYAAIFHSAKGTSGDLLLSPKAFELSTKAGHDLDSIKPLYALSIKPRSIFDESGKAT